MIIVGKVTYSQLAFYIFSGHVQNLWQFVTWFVNETLIDNIPFDTKVIVLCYIKEHVAPFGYRIVSEVIYSYQVELQNGKI